MKKNWAGEKKFKDLDNAINITLIAVDKAFLMTICVIIGFIHTNLFYNHNPHHQVHCFLLYVPHKIGRVL